MRTKIIVHQLWDISDGDYIPAEENYTERYRQVKVEERKTLLMLLLSGAALAFLAVLLILSVTEKIRT